jgi:hypothetical protein
MTAIARLLVILNSVPDTVPMMCPDFPRLPAPGPGKRALSPRRFIAAIVIFSPRRSIAAIVIFRRVGSPRGQPPQHNFLF